MSTTTLEPVLAALQAPHRARREYGQVGHERDAIFATVESAVAAVEPFRRPIERRREARYPYPYPIPLTPYLLDGSPDLERNFVVIGKHLAPHGIDFYCRQPLADRRVIASLDCGRDGWVGLVVELTWCRFSRHGWYDNGGRFIAVVEPPLAALDQKAIQRPPAA
jgi:hypothetical protein